MVEGIARLLLIEDDPGDVRLVGEQLRQLEPGHFEIDHAPRLEEGLRRLSDGAYDLILLDLNLPDSAGIATLERLHDAGVTLPIVVLTGAGDEQQGAQLVHRGAQDYLLKTDMTPRALVRSIRYALVRHATQSGAAIGLASEEAELAALRAGFARWPEAGTTAVADDWQRAYDMLLGQVLASGALPEPACEHVRELAGRLATARCGACQVMGMHMTALRRHEAPDAAGRWLLIALLSQMVEMYRDGVAPSNGEQAVGDASIDSEESAA